MGDDPSDHPTGSFDFWRAVENEVENTINDIEDDDDDMRYLYDIEEDDDRTAIERIIGNIVSVLMYRLLNKMSPYLTIQMDIFANILSEKGEVDCMNYSIPEIPLTKVIRQ